MAPGVLRLVTHLDVDDQDVELVCELLKQAATEAAPVVVATAPTAVATVADSNGVAVMGVKAGLSLAVMTGGAGACLGGVDPTVSEE